MERIAFIGVGNMAGAIIHGITAGKTALPYADIVLFDIDQNKLIPYKDGGAFLADSAASAVKEASLICLSVKPQQYGDVLSEIRGSGLSLTKKTFISLAAGVDTETINRALGGQAAVIRTMPNTPLLIGEGVTALCKNEFVEEDTFSAVLSMFAARGQVMTLHEADMNRIIAVTSSSIACFYRMIAALVKGAQAGGMQETGLREAAAQAAVGAAKMVLENKDISLDRLIAMVTSYKGTTEQMMLTLDAADFDLTMQKAMDACTNRANELGDALKASIDQQS